MAPIAPPAAIAFLGLGKMGNPMAARLAGAGYALRVFDTAQTAIDAFVAEHGGAASGSRPVRACRSPAEAARDAAAVITMLPDGKAVRQAVIEAAAASVVGTFQCGGVVIDMSSSSPVDTQALGAALAERGIGLIDAPVSGGVKRAVDGTLAVMVGGDALLIDRCRRLLGAVGRAIYPTGPLGSGHAMKALNNFVSAAGLAAASEALVIGSRFGLDPAVMVDVLNASTGRNNSTEVKAKQFMLSGSFASGFALGLMAKDIATAADLATHLGVTAPLAQTERRFWAEAQAELGPQADHTEIYRYIEDLGSGSD
jgi:3-hydroxyisobutyrate dehydrogenase